MKDNSRQEEQHESALERERFGFVAVRVLRDAALTAERVYHKELRRLCCRNHQPEAGGRECCEDT